jgi:hypothetical protein
MSGACGGLIDAISVGRSGCAKLKAAMRVTIEPALGEWVIEPRVAVERGGLIERINARAERLGLPGVSGDGPTIATGHQAYLWHPGILAKDIAMVMAAARLSAAPMHVVVDHDIHEALHLELPVERGEQLEVRRIELGAQDLAVPTGFQPAVDVAEMIRRLTEEKSGRTQALVEACRGLPACKSLAEQMAVILTRLKRPYAGDVPVMMSSDLPGLGFYEALVEAMRDDARRCVAAYNAAAAAAAEAGLSLLTMERERVELPLWAVRWRHARRRVFADLADSQPLLTFSDGRSIDRGAWSLLPRAAMLTAVMRSCCCELFIHGKGGRVYDRVTELWWGNWRGERLSPMAVASADVRLDFDVPVADGERLSDALWWRHHLPHNLDRALQLDGAMVSRKRRLLAEMDADGDKRRRREAFREIHAINGQWVEKHRAAIAEAEDEVARARLAAGNREVGRKRDWCFALYPAETLRKLGQAIADSEKAGVI